MCPQAADLMTTSSRSKTPSSLLSLSIYPNPQTQQAPHPFFPQHTPTKKFNICLVLLLLLAVFLALLVSTKPRCPSVWLSVLFCLSLLLPFNSKFKSQKKPGIFNLNRPNPKLDPTLRYSNSSTSRYPRTKFSKEKRTRP